MMADATARLLLACLNRDEAMLAAHGVPAPDSPEWDALVDLAAAQRVRPLLHRRLRAMAAPGSVPGRVLDRLDLAARQIAFRNLTYLGEVRALAQSLAGERIPLMVLKGVRLAAGVYESPSLREMTDIDLLVHQQHLEPVVEAVLARGYQPLHGGAMDVDVTAGHHLTRLIKPQAAAIEIHWNVTPVEGPRPIDPAGIWARAVPVAIGGAPLLGPCREDLLLHICHHAAYLHQFRFGLRPFCDISTLLAREGSQLDWPALVSRARDWRWDLGVYLMLRLAADLLGAPVPGETLAVLRPANFDEAVATAASIHVLADSAEGVMASGPARLVGNESAAARLRHLGRRLLPAGGEVRREFGDAPAAALPWLYARHVAGLVRRHGGAAARLLLLRDAALRADAARANLLRDWLGP